MATMVRSQFSDLLDDNFFSIAFEGYSRYPKLYDKYTDVISSKKYQEKFSQVGGLGMPSTKAEGTSITYQQIEQLYDETLTQVAYAVGIAFTREAVADQRVKILGEPVFKNMGIGFLQREETIAANVLNNGFTAGAYAGADAVALFSASHPRSPLLSSTTHSNVASTSADISVTSVEAALENAAGCLDAAGLKLRWTPKYIVVPTMSMKLKAEKLLESEPEAFITENTKNVLKQFKLQVIHNPFLSSSTAWFVLADKGDNPLKFVWREKPEYERDSEFNTKDLLYSGYMRCVAGFGPDWRGAYGNAGA